MKELDSIEREHAEMVARLAKPGEDILKTLTPEDVHIWHMMTGLVGEACELFEGYLQALPDVNLENMVEEAGDIEFYFQGLRQGLGIERDNAAVAASNQLNRKKNNYKRVKLSKSVGHLVIVAGTILDTLKKQIIYRKPMNRPVLEGLFLELESTLSDIRDDAAFTRREALNANVYKLSKGDKARYKTGYSDQAAQDRSDKAGDSPVVAQGMAIMDDAFAVSVAPPPPSIQPTSPDDGRGVRTPDEEAIDGIVRPREQPLPDHSQADAPDPLVPPQPSV